MQSETLKFTHESTPAELEVFLGQPEIIDEVHKQVADELSYAARYYLHETGASIDDHAIDESLGEDEAALVSSAPITQEIFNTLFKPGVPTIAVDIDASFGGRELIGIAAQDRSDVNVVYIANGVPFGHVAETTDGAHRLEVTRGVFLDHEGTAFYGDFPRPLQANLIETVEPQLLGVCKQAAVPTVNHPDIIAACKDKESLPDIVQFSNVKAPIRYQPEELWASAPDAEYVIKPGNRSQGAGVRMFEGIGTKDKALQYFSFLSSNGYEPVIENRIRSFPLTDPQTGQRLDWNVRALIANGNHIGMYIRADSWGKPVNKSLGAQSISVEALHEYGVDPPTAARLVGTLAEASKEIASQLPAGMAGLDLVVDESLATHMFETNIGVTGGLQTLALKAQTRQQKLANSHCLLDIWLADIPAPEPYTVSDTHLMASGFGSQVSVSLRTRDTDIIARLPLDDVLASGVSPYHLSIWSRLAQSSFHRVASQDKRDTIEKTICENYPLEAVRLLAGFILETYNSTELLANAANIAHNLADPSILERAVITRQCKNGYLADAKQLAQSSPNSLHRLAAATTAHEIYGDLGQHSPAVKAVVLNICQRYFDENHQAAIQNANEYLPSQDEDTATAIYYLQLALSLSERDFETAAQSCKALQNLNPDLYMECVETLLAKQRVSLLAEDEGVRFMLDFYASTGQVVQPLIDFFIAQLHDASYDNTLAYASRIASVVDPAASAEESAAFTTFLSNYAAYSRGTVTHFMPMVAAPTSRLSLLSDLLARAETGNWHNSTSIIDQMNALGLYDAEIILDMGYNNATVYTQAKSDFQSRR